METRQNAAEAAARLAREVEHHRRIASHAGAIWNWDTPGGRRRASRRAALLIEQARLGPACRALELGCGTGIFLEMAARSGARIAAVDLSWELLDAAKRRFVGQSAVSLQRVTPRLCPFATAPSTQSMAVRCSIT